MTRYTNCADIIVLCPEKEIQQTIQQVLYQNGFEVQWSSPVQGMAHQGTRASNFVFGPLLQYYEIVFQIYPMPDKSSVIRLIKSFRGYHLGHGRWLDFTLVEKKFIELVNMVSSYFYSMGWHQSTTFY
jgi:hypothetical protein